MSRALGIPAVQEQFGYCTVHTILRASVVCRLVRTRGKYHVWTVSQCGSDVRPGSAVLSSEPSSDAAMLTTPVGCPGCAALQKCTASNVIVLRIRGTCLDANALSFFEKDHGSPRLALIELHRSALPHFPSPNATAAPPESLIPAAYCSTLETLVGWLHPYA